MSRWSPRLRTSLAIASLLAAAGCRQAAQQKPPTIAHQAGASVTYTPPGCSYSITTPMVDSAEVGGTVASTQVPDHVHASFASDPSSSFAVNWRSEPAATLTELLYGTDKSAVTAATGQTATVKLQPGHTLSYASELDTNGPTRVHEVHVCGLKPSTTYYYKVGNPGAFSAVYALTTAPPLGSSAPIRFGVSGDSRDSMDILAKVESAIADSGATFQLFTGDAVLAGGIQSLWNKFFETSYNGRTNADVMATVPIQFTNGNHEDLAINYLAQFALPDVSSALHSEPKQWYSFNYGNIHFVALNDTTTSESVLTGVETSWLDSDLSQVDRSKTPWVFVFHHQPAYSCSATHGSNLLLRKTWQPLFDKYQVDVVFNGHVHNYERSKPIRGFVPGTSDPQLAASTGNDVPVNGSGTLYLVTGGAGAGLYDVTPAAGDSCSYRSLAEMTNNFVIVDVQGKHLTITTHRVADDSVVETISYSKD